jgi:hypothetical protein
VVSSATAANASEIKLPSRVAVRSAAEHLWSLATGAHAATSKTPAQETGKASSDPHQVPAAVTRAVHAATGHEPGKAPGQLPAYTWHAPQAKTYLAGQQPASGKDTYSAATSKLVPSDSTATSDMYRNADGSYTKHVYAQPVNYKNSSGSWSAINTNLASSGGRQHGQRHHLAQPGQRRQVALRGAVGQHRQPAAVRRRPASGRGGDGDPESQQHADALRVPRWRLPGWCLAEPAAHRLEHRLRLLVQRLDR